MPRILFLTMSVALAACASPEPAPGEAAPDAAAAAPAGSPLPPGVSPPSHPKPTRAETIPAAFHGVYDRSREACGRPSEYRLAVSALELRFHESIGTVRSVTVDSPAMISVAADFQGEGESWRAVHQLRLTEGGAGLTVTGQGTELVRVRCAALPAQEAPAR